VGAHIDSRQDKLLNKSLEEGKTRYNRKLNYLPVATPWGREMATQIHPRLVEAIRRWAEPNSKRKAGKLVEVCKKLVKADLDSVAYIVIRNVFSAMGEEQSLTSAAIQLGGAVEADIEGDKSRERMPEGVKRTIDRAADETYRRVNRHSFYKHMYVNFGYVTEWTLRERCQLGVTLLHILKNVSGVVEFVNVAFGSKRLRAHIVLSEQAKEWVMQYNEAAELLKPLRYPTVITPLDWHSLSGGGYPDLIKYPLIKVRRQSDRDFLADKDFTPIFKAVNGMQSVPWKVNQKILHTMREYHRRGLSVNEVVPFSGVIELPPYDPNDTDSEKKKEYKRQAFHAHLTNFNNKTKSFIIAKLLCIAETMKSHDAIYFPVQLDFRGRMYCFNELFHFQGNDTARGLLLFSLGKRLGEEGLRWMAIHGANKWGLDKKSYDERLSWVSDSMQNIQACAEDPVSNNWWTMADDPWQFLAFCMEYSTATPETISHLPCSLDATNNGLQILSMLMRDPEGCERTNVSCTSSPNDLYQIVADALISKLQQLDDPRAHQMLSTGLMSRKLVKTPVMTIPYGVTQYGITKHIDTALARELFSHPDAQKILPMSERREMSKWLTPHLLTAMEPYLGQARVCMDWLKAVSKPFSVAERPIRWKTPSGFWVNNDYRKYKEVEIRTALGDRFDYRRVLHEQPELDTRAATRTIAPNFVHSLDASVAHLVAAELTSRSIHFGIVHDCFFSHAASLSEVRDVVRGKYQDVFSENQLEAFRQQLVEQSSQEEIDKIPLLGKFSVDQLFRSDYFLS
jgi:DNA-directed RNA polymerase